MGKARSAGGLGWGDGSVAGVLFVLIAALVAYVSTQSRGAPRMGDVQQPALSEQ
jgi:uncharacterized membrane-anchored protein